jgi:hypothetical protein
LFSSLFMASSARPAPRRSRCFTGKLIIARLRWSSPEIDLRLLTSRLLPSGAYQMVYRSATAHPGELQTWERSMLGIATPAVKGQLGRGNSGVSINQVCLPMVCTRSAKVVV